MILGRGIGPGVEVTCGSPTEKNENKTDSKANRIFSHNRNNYSKFSIMIH